MAYLAGWQKYDTFCDLLEMRGFRGSGKWVVGGDLSCQT